ncbi:MAG: thiamine phosphate synthase [Pirellulales bacterium]
MPHSSDRFAAMRIFDASTNRALEAVRVVEDVARFALDDPLLTEQWKLLRHELAKVAALLPAAERLAARDTIHDVGTRISTESEQARADIDALLRANFERLKQSLRGMEESAKLLAGFGLLPPDAAPTLESLRYRGYTLEKATLLSVDAGRRLSSARLCWLTPATEPPEAIEAVLRAGVDVVQLRDKMATDRQLIERAKMLRSISRQTDVLFIVNDRADIAALCDADGVHVGQEELSVSDVRRIVGGERLVGVSTHDIKQARQAVLEGASYIGVGPTFPGATKQFDDFPGLPLIRQVATEIRLPWFAIGGIDEQNVADVMAAGAERVAVSGALQGDAAVAAAQQMKTRLDGQPAANR